MMSMQIKLLHMPRDCVVSHSQTKQRKSDIGNQNDLWPSKQTTVSECQADPKIKSKVMLDVVIWGEKIYALNLHTHSSALVPERRQRR